MIKKMNLNSFTAYERHQNNKKAFKEIMPVLSQLDEEEMRIFIHLIHSKNRDLNVQAQTSQRLLDEACSDFQKQRLAKISEEQNLMNKNRFYLDKNVMKYAQKERMPIDELKVKDMLRNQHHVRSKIIEEVGTYREFAENTSFEQGVLTYVNEAAWGDLRDLLKDIGLNRETVRYSNVSDLIKAKDERTYESDINFKNLLNARFTMIDMTDYESTFSGFNEMETLPLSNIGHISILNPEPWPESLDLADWERPEVLPPSTLGKTHRDLQDERIAAAQAEAEENEWEDDDDDDDDDDEDEEGDEEEGEEGGEEAEEAAEEEVVEKEPPMPEDTIFDPSYDDRYFKHGETVKGRFNEVELDGFMKLLNIKPFVQWQDDTTHHYKAGIKGYEDEAQMTDPYFHLLAEVERQHLERNEAMAFRRGQEIKLIPDARKAPVFSRQ